MSHKFPSPELLDTERQRQAAVWVAYALVGPLDKARELLDGRNAGPELADAMRALKRIEHALRVDPGSVELIEDKPPTVLSL